MTLQGKLSLGSAVDLVNVMQLQFESTLDRAARKVAHASACAVPQSAAVTRSIP
jgi:hypothetical protein